MSARLRGISNHALIELFEREMLLIESLGVREEQAEQLVALAVWNSLGMTPAEKKADLAKYFPPRKAD